MPDFPFGGGEAGRVIRGIDWASSPIGPMESWSPTLRSTVETLLNARHPMFLWWGPELIQFYNDAYAPSFGHGRHPAAMGQRGEACWQDAWHIIGPQVANVMANGTPTWHVDALVPIFRNERLEEVYWTYGYSPVIDDDRTVGGTLVVCTETTARVLGQRRQRLLRTVAQKASTSEASPAELAAILTALPEDVPFVARFVSGKCMTTAGLTPEQARWLRAAIAPIDGAGSMQEARTLPEPGLVAAPWPEPVRRALLVPDKRGGTWVFGLSPRLPLDSAYRDFLGELVEQLTLQQEHALAHHQLQRAHDERTALVRDLEAANRAKDEFLAMLGHELRNPLSPIVTALELLRLSGDQGSSREYIIIERQVQHLARLVDDLLDVAKVTSGKIDLRRETIEVGSVVSKAIEMVESLFLQRGHTLHTQLSAAPMPLWGDPVRLTQVVVNLLTNAARYTEPGGEIWVSTDCKADRIFVSVRDNGQGIAPELLPRIFDLFIQAPRSCEHQAGLGIGLTLVKNFVSLHGGMVKASSDGLGRGSRFTVELPRTERPSFPKEPARQAGKNPVEKRVLVVDDNADAAELLAMLLRRKGYDVCTANDAAEAIEMFSRVKPEVAVLDIGLPVMDGYELVGHLCATEDAERCRFLAVTGYGQRADRQRALDAGFAAHLVKPVRIEDLLAAIGE